MFAGEARCGGSAWRLVWSQQPNLDYGDVLQTRSEGSLGAVSVDRMKEPTGAGHCGAWGMYADTEDVRWAWPSARPGPHWRPLPVLGHLLLCILRALEQPSRPPPPAPCPLQKPTLSALSHRAPHSDGCPCSPGPALGR